jgi:hypothetical protein
LRPGKSLAAAEFSFKKTRVYSDFAGLFPKLTRPAAPIDISREAWEWVCVNELSGSERCGFAEVCYLADCLNCFGHKPDCPLYRPRQGSANSIEDFHGAIDELIRNTTVSYLERFK